MIGVSPSSGEISITLTNNLNKSSSLVFDANKSNLEDQQTLANKAYDNEIKRLNLELSNANSTIEKLRTNETKLREK